MKLFFLIPVISVYVNLVVGLTIPRLPNPYLDPRVPSACVAVVAGNKSDSYIRLIPNSKNEVSVLVLKHDDVVANNVPIFEAYNGHNIKVEDNKFVLTKAEPLFNGLISGEEKIAITQTDIYCVYVALEEGSKEGVTVVSRNEYGYLDFTQYILYSAIKVSWFIGLLVGVFLFYKLVAQTGNDFSNLNSISVISQGTIYFIMIPAMFNYTLRIVCGLVANNVARMGFFATAFVTLLTVVADLATLVVAILILFFCMGEGVIYYDKPTVSFRQMPDKSRKVAVSMFFASYATTLLSELAVVTSTPLSYRPLFDPILYGSFVSFSNFAYGVFWFIALVLYIYYYRQTRNTIQTHPPFGSEIEDSEQRNAAVLSAFKRSVFIIFGIPLLGGIVLMAITVVKVMKNQETSLDRLIGVTDPNMVLFILYKMQLVNRGLLLLSVYVNILMSFGSIVAIYFIWMRRNVGLVVDRKELSIESETGMSRYDIDSEDENVVL